MSYEGYEVVYCVCGYRFGSHDAYECMEYEADNKVCPVCSSTKKRYDSVDETNGCFCDELNGKICPCHEKITEKDIISYAPIKCEKCNGDGFVMVPDSFKTEKCSCLGKSNCTKCFGTGVYNEPFGETDTVCDTCGGRGQVFKPIYSLDKLNRKVD